MKRPVGIATVGLGMLTAAMNEFFGMGSVLIDPKEAVSSAAGELRKAFAAAKSKGTL